MSAIALIAFTQLVVGSPGVAYEGVVNQTATINNSDNTDVVSWEIKILDVPPGSAVTVGVLASGSDANPTADFFPDVPGSYRIQLTVSDGIIPDIDIRCFGIRTVRGIIIPPYQGFPDPLPNVASSTSGAKPDEQNYDNQQRGWAGTRLDGQLEQFMNTYDDLPWIIIDTSPFTIPADNTYPLYIADLALIGPAGAINLTAGRVGQIIRILTFSSASHSQESLTINPPGGHTIDGATSKIISELCGVILIYQGSNVWSTLRCESSAVQLIIDSGPWDGQSEIVLVTGSGARQIDINGILKYGQKLWITDIAANAETDNITISAAAGSINGTGSYVIDQNYGTLGLIGIEPATNSWNILSFFPIISGGGGVIPLSRVWYVDPGTLEASPDGSIGKPYIDIQTAFDAMILAGLLTSAGFTFQCAPGTIGNLSINDDVLDAGPVNVIGMVACKIDGNGPQAIIDNLFFGVGSSGVSIGFQNLQINSISAGGPTTGSVIFEGCYLGNIDVSLWSNSMFDGCAFQLSGSTIAGDNIEFRNIRFASSYTLTYQNGLVWDVASERNFLTNGGVFTSSGTIIKSLGDPYAYMAADGSVTSTGGHDRWIYYTALLTGNQDLRLVKIGLPLTGVTIDVYPQSFDIDVIDDASSSPIITIPSSAVAVRVLFTALDGELELFKAVAVSNLQA